MCTSTSRTSAVAPEGRLLCDRARALRPPGQPRRDQRHPRAIAKIVSKVVTRRGAEIRTEAFDRLCQDHIARFKPA